MPDDQDDIHRMLDEQSKPYSALSPKRRLALSRLREYLDELDEQTRAPGEPPLREAVAEQARQRLAEMDGEADHVCSHCLKPVGDRYEHRNLTPSGDAWLWACVAR